MLTKVGRRCHGRVGRARGRRLPAQDAPCVASHARGTTDRGARGGDDLVDLRIESSEGERKRRANTDWLGWGEESKRNFEFLLGRGGQGEIFVAFYPGRIGQVFLIRPLRSKGKGLSLR